MEALAGYLPWAGSHFRKSMRLGRILTNFSDNWGNWGNMKFLVFLAGLPQIMGGLHPQPAVGRRSECHLQAQGHFRGDFPFPVYNPGKRLPVDAEMNSSLTH
jgi:hypothetical protein